MLISLADCSLTAFSVQIFHVIPLHCITLFYAKLIQVGPARHYKIDIFEQSTHIFLEAR